MLHGELVTLTITFSQSQMYSFLWFSSWWKCPWPQNQLFLILETPNYLKQYKNNHKPFAKEYYSWKSPNLKSRKCLKYWFPMSGDLKSWIVGNVKIELRHFEHLEILKSWKCAISQTWKVDTCSKNGIFENMYELSNSLINRLLIVHGSRLLAHASRLAAQGSWLMGKKHLAHEPWALGHEPWTIDH